MRETYIFNEHATHTLKKSFRENNDDAVADQHVPPLQDSPHWPQVKITSLPKEYKCSYEIAERKEIRPLRSGQEHNRQGHPQEAHHAATFNYVQPRVNVRHVVLHGIHEVRFLHILENGVIVTSHEILAGLQVLLLDVENQTLSHDHQQQDKVT